VLEHVDDDAQTLRELGRVCRRDGALVISVPACPLLWGRQDVVSHHFRRYRRPEILERIRRAGFSMAYSTFFTTWLFPGIAAVRIGRRLGGGTSLVSATDFDVTVPPFVNAVLARLLASEAVAIGHWAWPFGVSLLAVASRKAA